MIIKEETEGVDLVSVIVPVYNSEKYINRCVASILDQTYQNLEIILVDDGSLDKSGKICDSYTDSRVKVIHQRNQGVSAARNSGIDEAGGEWICFIDSDDYVSADYIEYLLGLCKKHGLPIAQCGTVRGTDDDYPFQNERSDEKVWEIGDLYESPHRAFRGFVTGKIFHISIFDQLRFWIGKRIAEDEDVAFKAVYKAHRIVIGNRYLYYYFMSPESATRTKETAVNFDFVEIYENRIDFLEEYQETRLIDVTKKELCIRLMVCYIEAKRKGSPEKDKERLLKQFIQYYDEIKHAAFPKKESYALKLFPMMPDLFSFLENHIRIISRNKVAGEKRL